jgi:hypothetical protein
VTDPASSPPPPYSTGRITDVAAAAINGLKNSPALLTIVLLDLIVLAFIFILVREATERHDRRLDRMMQQCIQAHG